MQWLQLFTSAKEEVDLKQDVGKVGSKRFEINE